MVVPANPALAADAHGPKRSAESSARVAVLCVREQSIYKALGADLECYEHLRDARSYAGPWPVVAHPPCAQWGRLKGLATPNESLRALGPFCASMVRRWGGVLEHPAASSLWEAAGLPLPGAIDDLGGFTLSISQAWFGHRADKTTWLYVCGISPADLEPLPVPIFNGAKSIESMGLAEREATPPALARWLVALASNANGNDRARSIIDEWSDGKGIVFPSSAGDLELWRCGT